MPSGFGKRPWTAPACALILVLAGTLAYSNTFSSPFVLDDQDNILGNPSIRSLWPKWEVLRGAPDSFIGGRPVVNLSLALNWALSGQKVWSYHATNLAIHLLASLTLFGLVRGSFFTPSLKDNFGADGTVLAFLIALVWTLHPLQTQAVTYITERLESLMSLFFLATFYFALRGWQDPEKRSFWHVLSCAAFFLGVGSKEVIVVAPFLLFAYEFVLFKKNPGAILKESLVLYAGAAGGLILLAVLVLTGPTIATAYGHADISGPLEYLLAQPQVIATYLSLVAWPGPLCLDYQDWPMALTRAKMIWAGIFTLLVIAVGWSVWKRKPAGFLGAWFFLVLAPTSSIMPLRCALHEHRMYLPMAAVLSLVIGGGYWLVSRVWRDNPRARQKVFSVSMLVLLGLSLALGVRTWTRNQDYTKLSRIWAKAVEVRPGNMVARVNLGSSLVQEGDLEGALSHFTQAADLDPESFVARFDLGSLYLNLGQDKKALKHLEKAVSLDPEKYYAQGQLGLAYLRRGNPRAAAVSLARAVELKPNFFVGHYNLALALEKLGQYKKALAHGLAANRLAPDNPDIQRAAERLRLLAGQ